MEINTEPKKAARFLGVVVFLLTLAWFVLAGASLLYTFLGWMSSEVEDICTSLDQGFVGMISGEFSRLVLVLF